MFMSFLSITEQNLLFTGKMSKNLTLHNSGSVLLSVGMDFSRCSEVGISDRFLAAGD